MSESEESDESPAVPPGPDGEDLIAEVAAHDETLAASVTRLVDRVEDLESQVETVESELETAEERLNHTRADFKNYKERAKRRQEQIKERATEDLIERLLEVRDNLGRALADESGTVDSLREGVELTRKQFDRVLEEEDVERIDPDPGTEVDATRHEVMMRVESDHPADTIDSVYRPGYEMAGKILRPAQVTVSEAGEEATEDSAEETESGPASESEPTETESEQASGE
jgi:molecular chaperone GrpE